MGKNVANVNKSTGGDHICEVERRETSSPIFDTVDGAYWVIYGFFVVVKRLCVFVHKTPTKTELITPGSDIPARQIHTRLVFLVQLDRAGVSFRAENDIGTDGLWSECWSWVKESRRKIQWVTKRNKPDVGRFYTQFFTSMWDGHADARDLYSTHNIAVLILPIKAIKNILVIYKFSHFLCTSHVVETNKNKTFRVFSPLSAISH